MKKLLVILLVVFVVGVAACPPPPEKPECEVGQTTVTESEWIPDTYKTVEVCKEEWVCKYYKWGICWSWKKETVCHEERVIDVPGHYSDPVCATPEEKKGCAFTQYILQGNHPCYLQRGENDKKSELPARYDGTEYMQNLCKLCDGTEFKWNGKFITTCEAFEPCPECP